MPHFIKGCHSYTRKDLAAVYKPAIFMAILNSAHFPVSEGSLKKCL